MGPSPSTIDQEEAQEVSDERFKRLLDAETLQKTFSQISHGTEQTVFLGVHGWHTEEPSIYLMLDERPCNKPFDGWLDAKETALEFRFKIAADYPDSRARIPAYIESLLSNKDLLGISTLYIGPDPVRQCMDVLKKARSRRPRWSEPISLYNAQFSWMKRSPQSPSIYLKTVADSDEVCILIVNENTPVYKNEFGSDVHKFIQVVALPLRIKLRAAWWKGQLDKHTANNAARSPKEPEGQQWWWPLVQAQKDKQNKAKVKTTEQSETQLCAATESETDDSAEKPFTSPAQKPLSPSSSVPQTSFAPSKKKTMRKKKIKKGFQTALEESPASP
ncbi:hypothetical protein PHISP_06961, partial [Aspergillus sp. HF37]